MVETNPSSVSRPPAPEAPPLIPYAPAPPTPQSWLTHPTQTRIGSSALFSVSASMLALGRWMTPSPHGLGTHSECLGLPPCGFYAATGIPCPTCGCTTAVTWLAHGHVGMAFFTQPFGAVVGLLAVAGAVLGFLGLLTGRWPGPQLVTLQWHWHRLLFSGILLLVGAWAYKILMVHLGYC